MEMERKFEGVPPKEEEEGGEQSEKEMEEELDPAEKEAEKEKIKQAAFAALEAKVAELKAEVERMKMSAEAADLKKNMLQRMKESLKDAALAVAEKITNPIVGVSVMGAGAAAVMAGYITMIVGPEYKRLGALLLIGGKSGIDSIGQREKTFR